MRQQKDAVAAGRRAVIDALAAADAEAAQAAMLDHLSQTVHRVEALRAERPEYFL